MLTDTFIIMPATSVTGTGAADRYNNPQVTYPDGQSVKGRMWQRTSEENIRRRDTVLTHAGLILFPGTAISPYDRVRDPQGVVWEVEGQPLVASTPRGPHHVEVYLRHIAG